MGARSVPQPKDRGAFDALLSPHVFSNEDAQGEQGTTDAKWLPLTCIKTRPQPRRYFDEEKLEDLAHSFRTHGFKGAINVRPLSDNTYELIAGERRYRAAVMAGLGKVRCFVDDYTDHDALRFALAENLLRENLSKLEEVEGILDLIKLEYGISKEKTIKIIQSEGHYRKQSKGGGNVSPSEEFSKIERVLSYFGIKVETFRTKYVKGLRLPSAIKEAHLKGHLAFNAALELGKVSNEEARNALLKEAIANNLSFREVCDRVKHAKDDGGDSQREDKSLFMRLELVTKRVKKAKQLFEKAQKRKRLEKVLGELEALLK